MSYQEDYLWLIGAISSCLFMICLVPFYVLLCRKQEHNTYNNRQTCEKRMIRAELDPIKVRPSSSTSEMSRIEYFSRA